MDARRQKGRELARRGAVQYADGCYFVSSESSQRIYTVILGDRESLCECRDFEEREQACKHVWGAREYRDMQKRGVQPDTTNTTPSERIKRPTYPQNSSTYNSAKVNEKRHFPPLLNDLCRTIPTTPHPGRGRKPVPLGDQAFAAILKVYSGDPTRQFMGDLDLPIERGYVRPMHFSSVIKAMENKELMPILHDFIRRTAAPLAVLEDKFAPDGTGIGKQKFTRWFDAKYGVTRPEADWIMLHLMVGLRTHIVAAVEVEDKTAGEVASFPKLLQKTASLATIKEIDADKAYCTVDVHELVAALGATLFSPFKVSATGAAGGEYEKMYHRFCLDRENFLQHYHSRSNVESAISAIKRVFGDEVASKTDTAVKNEALAKVVCHNICCLIMAMYELRITPNLAGDEATSDILPFRQGI